MESLADDASFDYDSLPGDAESGGDAPFRVVALPDSAGPSPAADSIDSFGSSLSGPSMDDVFDSVGHSTYPPRHEVQSDTPTLIPPRPTDSADDELPWGDGPDASSADAVGQASADLPFHVGDAPNVEGDGLDSDIEALLDEDHFLFAGASSDEPSTNPALLSAPSSDPFAIEGARTQAALAMLDRLDLSNGRVESMARKDLLRSIHDAVFCGQRALRRGP